MYYIYSCTFDCLKTNIHRANFSRSNSGLLFDINLLVYIKFMLVPKHGILYIIAANLEIQTNTGSDNKQD